MRILPAEIREKLLKMPKDEQVFLLGALNSSTQTTGELLQVMLERAVKGLEEQFNDRKALATMVSMLSTLLGTSVSISNDSAAAIIKNVNVWGAIQHFQRESSSSALESLAELLSVAQGEDDTILQLDALQAMSFILSRSGQYKKAEEAITKLQNALNASDAITQQSYLLAIMNMRGWILRATGKVNESQNLLRSSVILSRAGNYDYQFADALSNLGITYWATGKFDGALVVLEDALAQKKSLNDLPGQAVVLNNLALIHRKKGTFEEARRCYEACLEIDRTLGNLHGVAVSQGNLANIFADTGALYEAQKRLEEALELKKKLEDKQGLAISYLSIAELLRTMGSLKEAEENAKKSIEIKQELEDLKGLAAAYRSLAEIFSARGDYSAALEQLDQALDHERRLNNRWGEAAVLAIYGKVYYLLADLEAAKESLIAAVQIQDELDAWESLDSRRLLIFVLSELGSTADALKLLEVIRTRSQDRAAEYAKFLVAKAILLSKAGQPSKGVLSYFWEAIEIGKRINLTIEDTFQAYLGIAAHLLARGQYDEAKDLLSQVREAGREQFPIVVQVQVLESLVASSQFNFNLAEGLLEKARNFVSQRHMGQRLMSDIEVAQQTIERTQKSLESLERLSPLIEEEAGTVGQISLEETLRYIETLQDRHFSLHS
ncbi:MAG: tetratricopeptide repeat protein [Candidatus Hodarchaeota archaeon]